VLRKALDGAALQGPLAPLLEKREHYEALLEGSGAMAHLKHVLAVIH
jgi:hypothetical protein